MNVFFLGGVNVCMQSTMMIWRICPRLPENKCGRNPATHQEPRKYNFTISYVAQILKPSEVPY